MLNRTMVRNICRAALAEDVGSGDTTTLAVVPEGLELTAAITARQACVCAGLPVAEAIFRELDPDAVWGTWSREGERCERGRTLARVTGEARALLTAERTALNFLQHLCGVATLTRAYVDGVRPHKAKILDTRKTTPGLRALEKYAVTMGGGQNHRFGLYDRVMIKDNHRAIADLEGPGGIHRSVKACRQMWPSLEVEVEADTLSDVENAVEAGADIILLDNMVEDEMAEAVELVNGRALLEASGGITLARIPQVAATGVDFISIGALTHSAPSIDISMSIDMSGDSPREAEAGTLALD